MIDESHDSPGRESAEAGPAMQSLKTLAANIETEEPETAGTDTGPGELPQKSLADYIPVDKLLAMAINVTCNNIKALKKYEISEADAQTLGNAWGPVLEAFMPSVPDGPWTNAILVTGVVVGPKISKAKKREKQRAKSKNETPEIAEQSEEEAAQPINEKPEESPQKWEPVSSRKKKKCK